MNEPRSREGTADSQDILESNNKVEVKQPATENKYPAFMSTKTFWAVLTVLVVSVPTITLATTQTKSTTSSTGGSNIVPVSSGGSGSSAPLYAAGIELPVANDVDYTALLSTRTTGASTTEASPGACTGRMEANGNGLVPVTADIVTLNFHVEVTDANIATAQIKVATATQAIFSAVTGAGIPSSDIVTTNFFINPAYDYNCYNERTSPCPKLTGYTVANSFTVTIRFTDGVYDASRVSAVLDAGVAAGGNNARLQGIGYDLSPGARKLASAAARALALQNALDKIASAKAAINVELGPFISVNVNDYNPAMQQADMSRNARPEMAMDSAAGLAPPSMTMGSAGKISISASAYITVSICN